MAKSFLRKIILEELKKVLKEQGYTSSFEDHPEIPGSEPGQRKSSLPKNRSVDFSDDPAMITVARPNPKVKELQIKINAILLSKGKPQIVTDGRVGPQTLKGLLDAGITNPQDKITPEVISQNIDSYLELTREPAKAAVRDYAKKTLSKIPDEQSASPKENWRKPFPQDKPKIEKPVRFKPSDNP